MAHCRRKSDEDKEEEENSKIDIYSIGTSYLYVASLKDTNTLRPGVMFDFTQSKNWKNWFGLPVKAEIGYQEKVLLSWLM